MFETPSANCASVGETQQTRPFEVKGINRAVYDVTSKPPGTIEGK